MPTARIYHDRDSSKKGVYFTDFELNFKREIIMQLSNPNKIDVLRFLFIKIRIQDLRKTFIKLKVLRTINFGFIFQNRRISKLVGKNFL